MQNANCSFPSSCCSLSLRSLLLSNRFAIATLGVPALHSTRNSRLGGHNNFEMKFSHTGNDVLSCFIIYSAPKEGSSASGFKSSFKLFLIQLGLVREPDLSPVRNCVLSKTSGVLWTQSVASYKIHSDYGTNVSGPNSLTSSRLLACSLQDSQSFIFATTWVV